jgi:uncharacterized protein (DUF2141 family)
MSIGRFAATLATLALLPIAALAGEGTLRVVAADVRSDRGSIVVWVYDNADNWLSDRWRTRKAVAVAGNRADDSVTVQLDLPPGEYAFSVFQDLDDDGKLARNFIGIPKEPAGLSNNVRPKFGPPRYKDAKFTIGDTPVEQRIELE